MALVASCKARGPGDAVGVSSRPGAGLGASAGVDAGAGAALGDVLPRDYATSFRKLTVGPVVSEGHGVGLYVITVFANESAAASYESGPLTSRYPAGAIFIAEHHERAAGDLRRGPTLMMERTRAAADAGEGPWRFVAVDSDGRVAADATTGLCAACHADAARDSVFPLLPRAP